MHRLHSLALIEAHAALHRSGVALNAGRDKAQDRRIVKTSNVDQKAVRARASSGPDCLALLHGIGTLPRRIQTLSMAESFCKSMGLGTLLEADARETSWSILIDSIAHKYETSAGSRPTNRLKPSLCATCSCMLVVSRCDCPARSADHKFAGNGRCVGPPSPGRLIRTRATSCSEVSPSSMFSADSKLYRVANCIGCKETDVIVVQSGQCARHGTSALKHKVVQWYLVHWENPGFKESPRLKATLKRLMF